MVRVVRQDWLDRLTRGDLVTVSLRGEQGKPRPALVIQADRFSDLASVTLLPITATLLDATALRIDVDATAQNGLDRRSHIMIDKPQTPPRSRVGAVIGRLDPVTMQAVNRALGLLLGIG